MILSPAFWGFTVSIMLGGSIVDFLGMRRLLLLSSAGYLGSVLFILFGPAPAGPVTPYYTAAGFGCLYGGFLTLGLSQGLVEGVINPLYATMYPEEKTHRFCILHAWGPGAHHRRTGRVRAHARGGRQCGPFIAGGVGVRLVNQVALLLTSGGAGVHRAVQLDVRLVED